MNNREQAQAIYNRVHPSEQYIRMMGERMLTPVQRATVDEIEAHLDLVDEVAAEMGVRLDADKIQFGTTRDEIVATAESKTSRQKRSAGARALSRKYGKREAERIIARKTGKHITLRQ